MYRLVSLLIVQKLVTAGSECPDDGMKVCLELLCE